MTSWMCRSGEDRLVSRCTQSIVGRAGCMCACECNAVIDGERSLSVLHAGGDVGLEREREGGKGWGILLARALSRASRERRHVSVHLADFLFADQPTLRTKRFGVREDVRVMVVDVCGGADYGLKESEIC